MSKEQQALVDWLASKVKDAYPQSPHTFSVYWDSNATAATGELCPSPLIIEIKVNGRVEYSKFSEGWTVEILEMYWERIKDSLDKEIALLC